MAASRVSTRARRRLLALLSSDAFDGERLLARLCELRSLEGLSACSGAVRLLAGLDLPEEEAENLLAELVEHRRQLQDRLGRDPGLHVAAIDFLSNVKRLLRNPTVIEFAQLEKTERGAMTDPLTSMYNRRYFEKALEVEIRRARRYNLALSLLMLDLDFFKSVNDIYGHVFGDLVLRQAGRFVRHSVRESDVACRFGGDEFSVILPETDRLGAHAVAERIRRRVESSFANTPIDGRLVAMTISGGLATYPEDGAGVAELMERADRALYRSKSRGKNGIVIYHSERRREVRYPARPSTRAEISGGGQERVDLVQPVNLSRGGELLAAAADCSLEGEVQLTLWEERDRWSIPGRVVRVVEEGTSTGQRLVAVAFDKPIPDPCLRRNVLYTPQPRPREGGLA